MKQENFSARNARRASVLSLILLACLASVRAHARVTASTVRRPQPAAAALQVRC
jgi:hypothetical protein